MSNEISMKKTYRTRAGEEVILYKIFTEEELPESEYRVHGARKSRHIGWTPETWKTSGLFRGSQFSNVTTKKDLIEVKEPREWDVWVNKNVVFCSDNEQVTDYSDIAEKVRVREILKDEDA